MIERRKPWANGIVALALKLAPPERRAWFEAMAAELDHVPERARWHFAAGCLFAAVRETVSSPQFLHAITGNLLIGGAMIWAAMNIRFAGRMSVMHAVLPEAFAYGIALLFVVGAVATARSGYRATISLAVPVAAMLTVGALVIRFGNAPTPLSHLYFALIVEDLCVLLFALMIAGAAVRFIGVRQALG